MLNNCRPACNNNRSRRGDATQLVTSDARAGTAASATDDGDATATEAAATAAGGGGALRWFEQEERRAVQVVG